MKIQDLIIDPRSLGENMLLVDIAPVYEYKDNRKTDKLIAHRYIIVLLDRGFEKISVKIEGKQLVPQPEDYVQVTFTELELYVYFSNGSPQVGARAKGISLVKPKT